MGTADELSQALQQIASSEDDDSTIVLTASITDIEFAGVAGKHVTVTSAEGNQHTLQLAACLEGDVTFDNACASLAWEAHDGAANGWCVLYACGHSFETTASFSLANRADSHLFGGGPEGQDVSGDTSLTLRGHADWAYVYGGGSDSAVSGSTSVLIDDANVIVDNVFGGGRAQKTKSGTVGGDARVSVRQGRVKLLFGGGQNIASNGTDDRTPATVSGTAYVTSGFAGAPSHIATIGSASFAHGGSWHSTVGNVRFSMLDGTWDDGINGGRSYYGCGLRDVVLGTVEMSVDVSDDEMLNASLFGGGESDLAEDMDSSYGAVQILNQAGEKDALTISYDAQEGREESDYDHDIFAGCDADIDMDVNGSMQINVQGGSLDQVILDSYGMLTATGGSQVCVTGGRIKRIQGLESHFESEGGSSTDSVIFTGCGSASAPTQIGYLYLFENANVTDGATVKIDASQFNNGSKPFYSVNNVTVEGNSSLTTGNGTTKIGQDLEVEEGSSLTTTGGQSWVFGNASIDGTWTQSYAQASDYNDLYVAGTTEVGPDGTIASLGTANLKGEVTNAGTMALMNPAIMQADYVGDDGTLCLPVVSNNYDGSDTGGTIPLDIYGVADGDSFVKVVSADDYTKLAMPALGQNYIVQEQTSAAKRRTFHLWNRDALAASLFLDNVADEAEGSSGWEWQIADVISVVFDLNEGRAAYDPWAIESEEHHEGETLTFAEPDDPTRDGYTFEGWNTKADGSGDAFTDETPVGRSMRVYAQWKKVGSSDDPTPVTPSDPTMPTTPEPSTPAGPADDSQTEAAQPGNDQSQQEKAIPQTGDVTTSAGALGILGIVLLGISRAIKKLG
uniref:InlB B-repeat-containing protein n=1 Tax=Parolsenella massiliensis TaxID=1871022 RepID=UPI000933C3DB|nr:InlB B-repeat-containing protein [Parolsenella massiliensis]